MDASEASGDAVHCAVGGDSDTVYRGDSLDFGASREFEGFNSFQSVLCEIESILFADSADFYQVLSKF